MSRQQKEEKENSGSSGKGLAVGLAVTALGVGIGTALYYFFSKDEENNHAGTSSEWEHQQAFDMTNNDEDDTDSYTTVSANTTTDTSMYVDESSSSSTSDHDSSLSHTNDTSSTHSDHSYTDISDDYVNMAANYTDSSSEPESEWDVTNTTNVPCYISRTRSPLRNLVDSVITNRFVRPRRNKTQQEAEHLKEMRRNNFRGRAYTLEECSICFEVMLQGEMLMGLPCTHNFHVKCISPWISEHQTCPVCREKC